MPHVRRSPSGIRNVTHLQHYAYRIAVRDGFSLLHSSKKLFLQYLLDAFATVDGNRLHYIEKNNKSLRYETFEGLADFVERRSRHEVGGSQGEEFYNRAGKTYLPPSFVGSVRHQKQNFNDAMVQTAHTGKPDLFITMTANSSWPEIDRFMQSEGHDKQFRPDIEARVFKIKLDQLLKVIVRFGLFENLYKSF